MSSLKWPTLPASRKPDSSEQLFGWRLRIRRWKDEVFHTCTASCNWPRTMYFISSFTDPIALPPENRTEKEPEPNVLYPQSQPWPLPEAPSTEPLYFFEGVVNPRSGRVYAYKRLSTVSPQEKTPSPTERVERVSPFRARLVSVVPPESEIGTLPMIFLEGAAGWTRRSAYSFDATSVFSRTDRAKWWLDDHKPMSRVKIKFETQPILP